jgi:hypothetical protein
MTTWRQSKDFDLVLSGSVCTLPVAASPRRLIECGQIFAGSLQRKRALHFSTQGAVFSLIACEIPCKRYCETGPARHSSDPSSPRPGRFAARGAEEKSTVRACRNQAVSRLARVGAGV